MKPYKSQYNEREFNRMAKRVDAYYEQKHKRTLINKLKIK
jgi:hypothetical protein